MSSKVFLSDSNHSHFTINRSEIFIVNEVFDLLRRVSMFLVDKPNPNGHHKYHIFLQATGFQYGPFEIILKV